MRFRKRWLFLVLAVLAALPGYPPVIEWGVKQVLKNVPGTIAWERVSGYALTGLRFEGVRVQGPGYEARLDEVRLGYNLAALLGRKLPLSLELRRGRVRLEPDRLALPAPGGGGRGVEPVLQRLVIEDVQLESTAWKRFVLPPYRLEVNGRWPELGWRLQTQEGELEGRWNYLGGRDWRTSFSGDVAVSRYWWDGGQYGRLEGRFGYERGHWVGVADLEEGGVTLAGFPVAEVAGRIRYRDHVITPELRGRALAGPVVASGVVDVPGRDYRFEAEGLPRLEALLELWNVRLPATGEGPLVIEGSGWEKLHLEGRFRGEGHFLNRPLRYDGRFSFADGFTLHAEAAGSFLERSWSGAFDWQDGGYTAEVSDDKGSRVELSGEGVRYRGQGRLVWPVPLNGAAEVAFAGEGVRWHVGVKSPGVGLLLAKTPLDLSGTLAGEGMAVSGRLGPLALDGAWDDLRLELDPIELVVGSVRGVGRWTDRFSARLDYTSPYLDLPVDVLQEGARWRLVAGGYGEGVWEDGRFRAAIENLPIEVAGGVRLSGEALWAPQVGWSGAQRWTGRYVSARSRLEGEALAFEGVAEVGRVRLPFDGVADAGGVRGRLDGARFVLAPGDYRLEGRMRFSDYANYQGDLAWDGARWSGAARIVSPWQEAVLVGKGALEATLRGYLQAEGRLFPQPRIEGVLRLPSVSGVAFEPLPLAVEGERLRVGDGEVALEPPFAFELRFPWSGHGVRGALVASGDAAGGRVALETPWGVARAAGAWDGLAVSGELGLNRLGNAALSGRLDLFAREYELFAALPDQEGRLELHGRGADLRWSGALQRGRLRAEGENGVVRLVAQGFDSTGFGLPGTWQGRLAYAQGWSGDLRFAGAWGSWRAHGFGTLQLEGAGPGYRSEGFLSDRQLFLRTSLSLPYAAGELTVRGPWGALQATGEGVWRLPGLPERPWTFGARAEDRNWSLGGPLTLQGQGLRYRGSLRWSESVGGRTFVLEGAFAGEGARGEGEATLDLAGYRVRVGVAHAGGWKLDAEAPGGRMRLADGVLEVPGWRLDPLGEALGAELGGRIAGRLDLEASRGSLAGALQVAGRRLGLLLRPRDGAWGAAVYDAAQGVGLRWVGGDPPRLEGLGKVRGALMLGPTPGGSLSYAEGSVGLLVEARPDGWRLRGRADGWRAEGAWFENAVWVDVAGPVSGQLQLDPHDWSYRGRLRYRSDLADALLAFRGQRLDWSGSGYAVVYQGAPQAGPLTAEGEGARWRVHWAAPLQLEASGTGLRLEGGRLQGAAWMGGPRWDAGRLRADLRYGEEGFSGEAGWVYPGAHLRARGEGGWLRLEGEAAGIRLGGGVSAGGDLDLTAEGSGRLLRSSWRLAAHARGRLLDPQLEALFRVGGRGEAAFEARFDYLRSWRLRLEGDALAAELTPDRARIAAAGWDLEPFMGLPVRVFAQGSGPPGQLELPLRLSGPWMDLAGRWRSPDRALELGGMLLDGSLEASWRAGRALLRLDLPNPRVVGEVGFDGEGWRGGFDLDLPLAKGGIRGRLDAADAQLLLEGYGVYGGRLRAGGRPQRIEGGLEGPELRLVADLLRIGEGWVGRARLESERWGGALAVAEGTRFRIEGLGPLEPLAGTLTTNPFTLAWAYAGPLPGGLGELEAAGRWPGEAWALGQWRVRGHTLQLEGRGGVLELRGEGLRARLTAAGPDVTLDGFEVSGARLTGWLRGGWSAPAFDLTALGLHLRGRAGAAARVAVDGWAKGRLEREGGSWRGGLEVPGGGFTAAGPALWPRLEGRWQGQPAAVDYPRLRLGGLEVDLKARTARGAVRVSGLALAGQEDRLQIRKSLRSGALVAEVQLTDGRARLRPEGLGEGLLSFDPGTGFGGTLILTRALPGEAILRGRGRALEGVWTHPETDWLPWSNGRLEAALSLDGRWSASYRGGEMRMTAEGDARRAALDIASPWGGGSFSYDGGWEGRVRVADWPVPALDADLDLEAVGVAGGLVVEGELLGDAGRASFNLRADAAGWLPRVDSAAFVVDAMRLERLPDFLNRLPYAAGRVDATLSYARGLWTGRLVSDALKVGDEAHPVEAALYWSTALKSLELALGQSRIEARLEDDRLELEGELIRLPLHFLTGAWAGPPPGTAFWTGALRVSAPLQDPWAGYAVLVGERLDFAGEGKRLEGEAALRYDRRTLRVDALDLRGDGRISGSGFWGPGDADLKIEVRDTLLTPILGVVPQWRSYRPRAEGSLTLHAQGRNVRLEAEGLRLGLASVDGRLDWLQLERDGDLLKAGGSGTLDAPYPARFTIAGQGPAQGFELGIEGSAELPLVGGLEGVRGVLRLPGMELDLRAGGAQVEGRLWPLELRLRGELPVAYPEYYLQSGLVRPDLVLAYEDDGFTLSGETEVVRAVLSRPEGEREVAFEERRYRYPLRFDRIRIYSKGGLLIQEPLAQGEAAGEVYLGGELADPFLSGEVTALRGEFLLGRHRFTVDQAWARFSPAEGLYPEIYLRAHAGLRTADGEIELVLESQGRFVREGTRARLVLEPRLWAEAGGEVLPYGQEELLGFLALGGESTVAEGVASLAIQNLLISQLEYELARALGLDVFTVQTDVFSGGGVGTTQFTVGKYLSPDLFVSYSLDLGGRQVLGAEYRIDGLRMRVESSLGGDTLEPVVRFSMLYAIRSDLDLILMLRTGELRLELEWRF